MAASKSGKQKNRTKNDAPPRRNKTVGLEDALGKTLDPVFKKRGFASRDLIARWAEIVPAPFNTEAAPDRLSWPRGQASEDGATLFVACAPQHALALQHEADRIRSAINQYFGYLLVGKVKQAKAAFSKGSAARLENRVVADPAARSRVEGMLGGIEDEKLRGALRQFGLNLMARKSS